MPPPRSASADGLTEHHLVRALGPAYGAWTQLVARLSAAEPALRSRWHSDRRTGMWSLQLWRGRRRALALLPRDRCFVVEVPWPELGASENPAVVAAWAELGAGLPWERHRRWARAEVRNPEPIPAICHWLGVSAGATGCSPGE